MMSINFIALRFPILFGSFLAIAGTSFIYREDLMPDLEEAKKTLNKQDERSSKELQDIIRNMKN